VNVGANTNHRTTARSPIFLNDKFIYISFPHPGEPGHRPYPRVARPFTRKIDFQHTHYDPDWPNLTYGDYCGNPRAAALKNAVEGDILLFWGLLWRNTGRTWHDFTGERGWYLIGALRIGRILDAGQRPKDAGSQSARAAKNVHFYRGVLDEDNRVFIGTKSHSSLFPKAVDLEATRGSGLLFRTIRAARGGLLRLRTKPHWNSSTRPCRVIWHLDKRSDWKRAWIVRQAIKRKTGYDLLADIPSPKA
jgi:hypothetical protein